MFKCKLRENYKCYDMKPSYKKDRQRTENQIGYSFLSRNLHFPRKFDENPFVKKMSGKHVFETLWQGQNFALKNQKWMIECWVMSSVVDRTRQIHFKSGFRKFGSLFQGWGNLNIVGNYGFIQCCCFKHQPPTVISTQGGSGTSNMSGKPKI